MLAPAHGFGKALLKEETYFKKRVKMGSRKQEIKISFGRNLGFQKSEILRLQQKNQKQAL